MRKDYAVPTTDAQATLTESGRETVVTNKKKEEDVDVGLPAKLGISALNRFRFIPLQTPFAAPLASAKQSIRAIRLQRTRAIAICTSPGRRTIFSVYPRAVYTAAGNCLLADSPIGQRCLRGALRSFRRACIVYGTTNRALLDARGIGRGCRIVRSCGGDLIARRLQQSSAHWVVRGAADQHRRCIVPFDPSLAAGQLHHLVKLTSLHIRPHGLGTYELLMHVRQHPTWRRCLALGLLSVRTHGLRCRATWPTTCIPA